MTEQHQMVQQNLNQYSTVIRENLKNNFQNEINSQKQLENMIEQRQQNGNYYSEKKDKIRNNLIANNLSKILKRKRKNRNCRGQFRHETMEIIKLGKNNNITIVPKSVTQHPPSQSVHPPSNEIKQQPIETTINKKVDDQQVHQLPQMVVERRQSIESSLLQVRPPPSYHSPPRLMLPPTQIRPTIRYPSQPQQQQQQQQQQRIIPQRSFQQTHGLRDMYRGAPTPYLQRVREHDACKLQEIHEQHQQQPPIDLRIDAKNCEKEFLKHQLQRTDNHKCHCECGKTMNGTSNRKEIELVVPSSAQVPSTNIHLVGRCPVIVDNKQRFDYNRMPPKMTPIEQQQKDKSRFLIKDIIANKTTIKHQSVIINRYEEEEKRRKLLISPPIAVLQSPSQKTSDHSVEALLNPVLRRASCDYDTASVSSVGSYESSTNIIDSLIPHGKLVYLPEEKILLRYNVDAQKKCFINNIIESVDSDEEILHRYNYNNNNNNKNNNSEVVKLPDNFNFNSKDNLSVEDYVKEMEFAERIVPKDFFHFYKFVTGYQICNNNLPVSFLTFLKIYNTNGLNNLLERYVRSLNKKHINEK